jgi:hypothetical protein
MKKKIPRSLRIFAAAGLSMPLFFSCAESGSPTPDVPYDPGYPDMDIVSDHSDVTDGQDGEVAPSCGSGGSCSAGYTCCPDNRCYNLTNDPSNCGECGSSCSPKGNMCIAGNCSCNGAAPCTDPGDICCTSGGCLDPMYDPNNCGSCGMKCSDGQACVAGTCGGSCEGVGCPDVPHGTSECVDGICVISSCDDGWADGDGNVANGCECEVTAEDNGGPSCDAAYDLGELHDSEPGESRTVEGFCSLLAPEDWYAFDAIDDADTACDNFHVDIRFLSNPGRSYVFDVRQASCTTGTVVCENDTEYVMAVDTRQPEGGGSFWGECPCKATAEANANLCTDNSSPFFVVVKLAEGADPPGCEPYRLEISNGKYNYTP